MRIHLSLPDEVLAILDAAAAADAPLGFAPDRSRAAAVAIVAHFGSKVATKGSPVARPAQVRPPPPVPRPAKPVVPDHDPWEEEPQDDE